MIRKYKNGTIYKFLNVIFALSGTSFVLSAASILAFIIVQACNNSFPTFSIDTASFFIFGIFVPLNLFLYAKRNRGARPATSVPGTGTNAGGNNGDNIDSARKVYTYGGTKTKNDVSNAVGALMTTFIELGLLAFISFIDGVLGRHAPSVWYWQYFCYLLPSHIFSYVGGGFTIAVIVLVKREWKEDPPLFIKEKYEKKRYEEQRIAAQQNNISCKTLLEKCGMRFFIKYYPQAKKLPIRDVLVDEAYTPQEKSERLDALKSIIDAHLEKTALKYIIDNYAGALTAKEISAAQDLLCEDIHGAGSAQAEYKS